MSESMQAGRFRKCPIEIEARRCTEKETIHTLEGDMLAGPGDWIITGIAGEQYPCKDDIFRATYEPTDDASMELFGTKPPSVADTQEQRA